MAGEFDHTFRALEGFPSFQDDVVVAVCNSCLYICLLSGRASDSSMESLQEVGGHVGCIC